MGSVIALVLRGACGALELLQPLLVRLELPVPGHLPAPYFGFFYGYAAGVYAGLGQGPTDHGETGYRHAVADRQVTGDANRAPDDTVPPDDRAAGHAGTAGDHRVCADADVVTDLDLIIQLGALLDDRVLDSPP